MSLVTTYSFDETSKHWSNTSEYNRLFLQSQQNWMNDLLRARGHLFLNETHDALGYVRTKRGQTDGWSTEKNANSYVNFNIFENEDGTFTLSFNDDGVIYDLLPD